MKNYQDEFLPQRICTSYPKNQIFNKGQNYSDLDVGSLRAFHVSV